MDRYQLIVQLMQQVIGVLQQSGQEGASQWAENMKNMVDAKQIDGKAVFACMRMARGSAYVNGFYSIEAIQRRLQAFIAAVQTIEAQRIHTCNAQKLRDNVYELIQQLFANRAIDGYVIKALEQVYNINSKARERA